MKILVATKNKGKFNEIAGFLGGVEVGGGGPLTLEFLGDYDVGDLIEDGETHRENAEKKARQVSGLSVWDSLAPDLVLAEDSGIYVEALKDELGIHTRRWGAGESATDEEWLEFFMKEMAVRAPDDSQRGAKFVCNACLARFGEDGKVSTYSFEGETFGKITDKPMAPLLPGLPLSSVFLPDGFDRVYAALSREEKNKISHRGQAMAQVKKFLEAGFSN